LERFYGKDKGIVVSIKYSDQESIY